MVDERTPRVRSSSAPSPPSDAGGSPGRTGAGVDGSRGRQPEPGLLPAGRFQRVLTLVLVGVLVVATAGVVAVAVAPPETADPFTEFHVLGDNGTAGSYPTAVQAGDPVEVRLGIENHEHERTRYVLRGAWNDSNVLERNVTLADGDVFVRNVSVRAPEEPGRHRLLYHLHGGSGEDGPQTLRLWVRVQE